MLTERKTGKERKKERYSVKTERKKMEVREEKERERFCLRKTER